MSGYERFKKRPDMIVIHCAYTPRNLFGGSDLIDHWHKERGWIGVGYHYVIRRDGTVDEGRPLEYVGAHALPVNHRSIGVCMMGGKAMKGATKGGGRMDCNFAWAQWQSLAVVVRRLASMYDIKEWNIVGHNDVDPKTCPTFDVAGWRQGLLK